MLLCGFVLMGCESAKPTAARMITLHGLDERVVVVAMGEHRWRLQVLTSALFFDESAEGLLKSAAEQQCKLDARHGVTIEQMVMGIQNSFFGGRRFAEAIIRCSA